MSFKFRTSKKIKIGIIIVFLIAFFIVLNLTNFAKEIKNFFYRISLPIQKILWQAGNKTSDFFEMIFEFKELKKENEELKLKLADSLAENLALEELRKENESLRKALEIGLEKDFKLILVQIIGKDISQDSILINKGSLEGITENLAVITPEKIILGKVSEVYRNFSRVTLITDKKSTFDGKIAEKEIQGVVKGKGNLKLFLDAIPRDTEVKDGDIVVTTHLGGIYPENLLVGKIKEIRKSDIEPFQQAEIFPFFEIGELENLFVITDY